MHTGRQVALVVALVALAVALLAGDRRQSGGAHGARAAVTMPPLTIQAQLANVKPSITNWDQFAAANNISGWGADPSIPPCLWTGVACDADGRLISLSFACINCSVKAEGVVPPVTSATMATLNMQQNALGGPLPVEYAAEDGLPNLVNLILIDNQLTGSIPEQWGQAGAFPRLTLLGIGQNRLGGTLPHDMNMPALLILRANSNNFSGPLPVEWGSNASLPAVRVLALHANALTGRLPAEWAEAGWTASLEELYLQNNQLSGGLPPSWGSDTHGLHALRLLNVSDNVDLGGTLPSEWSAQHSFPALRTLALSNIGLQGTLPPSWDCQDPTRCGLAQLETLWLNGNNLSGPVPPSWSLLPALQNVFVRPGNDGLCSPAGNDFRFRLCDARGGVACRDEVQLPTCSPTDGAAAPSDGGGGVQPQAGASPSEGGSSTGAIVGGVVGGASAAVAAVALALLLHRRRRRRKTARELPFFAPEETAEKSSEDRSSPFVSRLPGTPLPPSPGRQPRRASDDEQAEALMLSPFAAAPAGVDLEAALGAAAGEQQAQQAGHYTTCSTQSSDAFLLGLVHGNGAGAVVKDAHAPAGTNAVAADRVLDDEMERHLSIELAALQPSPTSSTTRTPRSVATGGTSGPAAPASPVQPTSQETSSTLSWEDSVPLSDWQITPSEIEICQRPDGSEWELGSGGFGKVYKALRHGAQPVAVKVLAAVGDARYQSQEDFKREIAILRACRDPNIVAFLGASLLPRSTMLVTEYCDGGNLTRNLMAGRVTWHKRGKKIALDVARGLTYLHSRRIIHFDLKSPNILLARDGTAKISDVGMAKIVAREYSGVTGNVGTLAWAAPEMLLGARCTEKADIYSYGVVLWEICTGATPIRGQLRDVKVPVECPPEVRELILDCLATNPRKRPSAVEVVERLRAMPDPPSPARQLAPPPGGRPGTAGAGTAAARLNAAAHPPQLPPLSPRHRPPGAAPQRLSSESDASLEAPLTAAELEAAYASPAHGAGSVEALAAAVRLAAAAGDPTAAMRRSCSVLLAALVGTQPKPPLEEPPHLMGRASSSPPGDRLQLSPGAPILGSPGALLPTSGQRAAQRQLSLDDPAKQAAELQRTFLQLPLQFPAPAGLEARGHRAAAPSQQQPEQHRPPRPHPPSSAGAAAISHNLQLSQADQDSSAAAESPFAQLEPPLAQQVGQEVSPPPTQQLLQQQSAERPAALEGRQPSTNLSAFWAQAQHAAGLQQLSPFSAHAQPQQHAAGEPSPFAQAHAQHAQPAQEQPPASEALSEHTAPPPEKQDALGGQQVSGGSGGSPPTVRLSTDSSGSLRDAMEARHHAAKVALSQEQSRQQVQLSKHQHQERQLLAWEHLREVAEQQHEEAAAQQAQEDHLAAAQQAQQGRQLSPGAAP